MSMRTLFCGSCAAVALAVGVYLAADCACKHPDSLAGRCARGALQLGLQCCPAQHIIEHVRGTEPKKEACSEETCEVVVPPPAVEPQEVIDLSQVGVGTPPLPVADPENPDVPMSPEQRVETAPCASEPCPTDVIVAPGDVEECEEKKPVEPPLALDPDVPATMPPCADDDEPAAKQVECGKPTSEESAVKEEACDACWWFFEEKDDCPDKQPMCDEPCDKPGHSDGGAEESEPIMGGKPADCQVDPNYHHEYPSCSYTGKCYPSTTTEPADTAAPAPAEKKPHKKKVKSEAPKTEEVPTPASIDEDTPQEPSIDTMEFRKSDAKKGEFKAKTW